MVAEEGERDAGAQELRGRGSASATIICTWLAFETYMYRLQRVPLTVWRLPPPAQRVSQQLGVQSPRRRSRTAQTLMCV